MPIALVDSDSKHTRLGAGFRRKRPGPELDLVDGFLEAMPLQVPRGCRVTVFREPRIESGFPDLVIVVWREATTRRWKEERTSLKPQDMRIMHFLHRARKATSKDLASCFRGTTASLERLHNAEVVRQVGRAWVPRALSWSFAARKIIAVEAKIGKWADALDQAVLNTWFASKSYILIPNSPPDRLLEVANRLGIGIISMNGEVADEIASPVGELPRSYVSWMFNDWAWRASL